MSLAPATGRFEDNVNACFPHAYLEIGIFP